MYKIQFVYDTSKKKSPGRHPDSQQENNKTQPYIPMKILLLLRTSTFGEFLDLLPFLAVFDLVYIYLSMNETCHCFSAG